MISSLLGMNRWMQGALTPESEAKSRRLGAVIGPVLMAVVASEFPLVQPNLYDEQIPPVVYLSGTLFFAAGVAIVRAHNRWARDWSVLITLIGWSLAVVGLVKMFFATRYPASYASAETSIFMVIEVVLFLVGLVITVQSYRPRHGRVRPPRSTR